MRTFVFCLFGSLLFVAPAMASKDKKPVDPDKKTCRRVVETGSIAGKSICHTNAEWAQIDAGNAQQAGDILDRPVSHMGAN
jgi:hypothetical protein